MVIAFLAVVIVGAEIFLEGDAYVLAFTMCVALTPPALAGVDDFAVGWNARASASDVAVEPEELRAAGEEDDARGPGKRPTGSRRCSCCLLRVTSIARDGSPVRAELPSVTRALTLRG